MQPVELFSSSMVCYIFSEKKPFSLPLQRGEQIESDVGYWIVNLDRNSPQILLDHVPEMNAMQEVSKDQCQEYLFCGMPLYYPAASLLRYNNWIPASMPRLFRQTKLELLTTEDSGRLQKKLLFRVTGKADRSYFVDVPYCM